MVSWIGTRFVSWIFKECADVPCVLDPVLISVRAPLLVLPSSPSNCRLKNESSMLSLTVRELTTQYRLLLTGTPLQVSRSGGLARAEVVDADAFIDDAFLERP